MHPKHPSESLTVLTDLVLPSETNPLNNLFGGELLARMDRAASISARRHSRRVAVTASVNHVAFNRAIPLGSVVTVEAKVSRSFKSSMEIFIDVWIEDRETGTRSKANEAIYTFVAVDDSGRPVEVPPIIPETELEKADRLKQEQINMYKKQGLKEFVFGDNSLWALNEKSANKKAKKNYSKSGSNIEKSKVKLETIKMILYQANYSQYRSNSSKKGF